MGRRGGKEYPKFCLRGLYTPGSPKINFDAPHNLDLRQSK